MGRHWPRSLGPAGLNATLALLGETAAMKFAPFVLVVILVGALIGWFAPGGSGTFAAPGSATAQEATARLDVDRNEPRNGGDVILPRAGDGHFYADVVVDGASTRMLVDTGASMVALTGEDADAMGVKWDPQDLEQVARGAGGPVYGVRVSIERMQLGDFEARSVEAVIVPEGLGVSLLGQSFLAQIPRVEMSQNTMVLGG
jgi:aspartyl protease family protein